MGGHIFGRSPIICLPTITVYVYHFMNNLCGDSETALKEKFLIPTDEVEERVDAAVDSEEDESSSVGDSEQEDVSVQEEVGEIIKAFSTMAVGDES